MKLQYAQQYAIERMEQLALEGWRFEFDNAIRRFGACHHTERKITISRKLTELNDVADVQDTILHEIAHALAGASNGHNEIWKRYARLIGAEPNRCYSGKDIKTPKSKWLLLCQEGCEIKRHRKPADVSNYQCKKHKSSLIVKLNEE